MYVSSCPIAIYYLVNSRHPYMLSGRPSRRKIVPSGRAVKKAAQPASRPLRTIKENSSYRANLLCRYFS